jgi:hypothetical protein
VPPLRLGSSWHDNGVIYQGIGETVGGRIGDRPNDSESHDFERDFEETREPAVVCQGRRVASAAGRAGAASDAGLGLPVPRPAGRPPGVRIEEYVH